MRTIEKLRIRNRGKLSIISVKAPSFLTNMVRIITGNINSIALKKNSLEWLENLTGYNNQDFREWLRIVFENSSEDNIYIYIEPVEENGHVKNHVILHIDYNGSENEIYSRDIYRHVQEAAGLTDEIESGTEDTKITRDIEQTKTKIQKER